MTENYTFVTLVNILKLTALQMLSLKAFIYIQEGGHIYFHQLVLYINH
jgi:hypothetical protein